MPKKIGMTEAYWVRLDDEQMGLCIECGLVQGPLEPDARLCKCEGCGQNTVYGAQELVVMDIIHWLKPDKGGAA